MNVGYLVPTLATQHVFCEQNDNDKDISISANQSVVRSVDSQAVCRQRRATSPPVSRKCSRHCIVRDVRASRDQVGHKSNRRALCSDRCWWILRRTGWSRTSLSWLVRVRKAQVLLITLMMAVFSSRVPTDHDTVTVRRHAHSQDHENEASKWSSATVDFYYLHLWLSYSNVSKCLPWKMLTCFDVWPTKRICSLLH